MKIEVNRLSPTTKSSLKAEVSLNLASLVQLWDKCEDAKVYISRLNSRMSDYDYCKVWAKKIDKANKQIIELSEEITRDLNVRGAFDPLAK
jgi:hypothetical protein